VPGAATFVSGVEWLQADTHAAEETGVGRLLLTDRSSILVSAIAPGNKRERAVFGEGFGNGLVIVARRLMSRRLVPGRDPAE